MALGQRQFDRLHMQACPDTDDDVGHDRASSGDEDLDDDDPFPSYDVSTLEARKRLLTEPTLTKKPPPAAPPTNSYEATAQLATCQPYYMDVDDLRLLLEARADPNVVPGCRDLSPLQKVRLFARTCNAADMRELLLQYGANESAEDNKHWRTRLRAEANEPALMYNMHKDDRMGA